MKNLLQFYVLQVIVSLFMCNTCYCSDSVFKNTGIYSVNGTLDPGSVNYPSAIRIIYGDDPGYFSQTPASGGNGTYQYQWQFSTDGGNTWNDVIGAINADFDPGSLYQD